MKLIKRLSFLLIIALIILIYISNIDKKIYYVSLGDSLAEGMNSNGKIGYGYSDYVKDYLDKKGVLETYTKKFSKSMYRTTDLINDINNNKSVTVDDKTVAIKNALMNADLVTLSIGTNDLFYKLGINNINFDLANVDNLYGYIDEIMEDIDKLLDLIQKYCKEDIIILGYYNPLANKISLLTRELEPIFIYGNDKLKQLAYKHDIYFVDVYQIFKENPQYLPNPLDIHPSDLGYQVISKEIITVIENKIFK